MVITKTGVAPPDLHSRNGRGAGVAASRLDDAGDAGARPRPRLGSPPSTSATGRTCSTGRRPTEGAGFEYSPSLKPIEAFRNRTLVFTGLDNFQATDQGDVGGQHPRAAPAFMSCAHPKQTEGADVRAGVTIDQLIAEKICRDTKLSSLEVSVDRNDVVGACDHGYACAYMNSLAWKSPTTPLPSETNPRFVFERMFGIGATAEERLARTSEDRSILDGLAQELADLRRQARRERPHQAERVLRRRA